MPVELSDDLQRALDTSGTPLKLVDPRTGASYLLVTESAYGSASSTVDVELTDTYRAQVDSALKAGWDDPAMDEYNDYDRYKKQ